LPGGKQEGDRRCLLRIVSDLFVMVSAFRSDWPPTTMKFALPSILRSRKCCNEYGGHRKLTGVEEGSEERVASHRYRKRGRFLP